jgi:hypothetical protein
VCYSLSDVPGGLREHIESSTRRLWVSTAFLDNCGLELLKTISGKGVELRVLVSTCVGSELLGKISKFADVRVMNEGFMHANIYIADDKALIGSPSLTCPVLEGKNIEVLCEIPLEKVIKVYNSLWENARPFKLETLQLRIKDSPDKIIINSNLGQGLHIEVDKVLKRIVRKIKGKVHVCPPIIEQACVEFKDLNEYGRIVSAIFGAINEVEIDLCSWTDTITYSLIGDLVQPHITLGQKREMSPAYFIIAGLEPLVSHLYSDGLRNSVTTMFSEVLKSLNLDYVNKCVWGASSLPRVCVRILEKPELQIIYDIEVEVRLLPQCDNPSQDVIEKIKEVFNKVKPIFEGEVRKLYSSYLNMKKEYGKTLIDIDGVLTAYLRLLFVRRFRTYDDVRGVIRETPRKTIIALHEVELGAP